MYKGHRYIDADSHVLEPANMWEKYLDPKFRRFAPTHGVGYRGDPPGFYLQIRIGGSVMPTFQMPELAANARPGGSLWRLHAARLRTRLLPDRAGPHRDGLHGALYPTIGLYCHRGAGAVGRGSRGLSARLQQLAARFLRSGGSQAYRRRFGRLARPG